MFKKVSKVALLIGILFLSISFTGCNRNKKEVSENIKYELIGISSYDYSNKRKAIQINTTSELNDYVYITDSQKFSKYDEKYFLNNSIILFYDVESSGGNKTKITSYQISNNIITINVETYEYGLTCDMAYYLFVLELDKEEVNFININKDGKLELTSDSIF